MRVLIDGCGAASAGSDWAAWWEALLAGLCQELPDSQVYYLNRGPALSLPECANLRPLFAPVADLEHPALEAQRLAALCRELAADVFLSPGLTGAAGATKAMIVLEPGAALPPSPAGVLARGLAHGVWSAAPQAAAQPSAAGQDDAPGAVWVGPWPSAPAALARALRELLQYDAPAVITSRRAQAVQNATAEALRLNQAAEAEAVTVHAQHAAELQAALRHGRNRRRLRRAWQALRDPRRYPEYARQLGQLIRSRLPPGRTPA